MGNKASNEIEKLKKALNDYGYSPKAIREIMKWYELLGKESHEQEEGLNSQTDS